MRITSLKNPRILALRKLYKSRDRKDSPFFLVEGVREVLRGLQAGFSVSSLLYCEEIAETSALERVLSLLPASADQLVLSRAVYEKLAYRDSTEGVIGVFVKTSPRLVDFIARDRGPYLLLEGIQKPGNLGAILRTADAVGCPGVLITGRQLDPWHPNVIRASQGGVFTVPVICTDNQHALNWSLQQDLPIYAAALPSYSSLYDLPLAAPCVLAFGTEAEGLSTFWIQHAKRCFTIPMSGGVDSLNVSVSVAIALYESHRQMRVSGADNSSNHLG